MFKAVDSTSEKIGLNFVQIIAYPSAIRLPDGLKLEDKFDICVANTITFNDTEEVRKEEECSRIVDELLTNANAKAVILFIAPSDIECILIAAQEKKKDYFQWIILELQELELQKSFSNINEKLIVIRKESNIYNTTDFCKNHLDKLSPENNTRNPYFTDLWQRIYSCDLNDGIEYGRKCSKDLYQQTLSEAVGDGAHVSELIISFLVYGMALRSAWQQNCKADEKICDKLRKMDASTFFNDFILNVNFKDAANEISFSGKELSINLKIRNFRKVGSQRALIDVAKWYKNTLITFGQDLNISNST
ncbi:metabotropic glutamate receptor-like protein, partial [Leptotrombidium deliense]